MRPHRALGLALLAALAGGCLSAESGPAPPATGTLDVGLLDYELVVSHDAVAPGTLVVETTNAGADAHDLAIAVTDREAATPRLAPGDSATLSLTVPETAKHVRLWCTLPGHRSQGMETTLAVRPD